MPLSMFDSEEVKYVLYNLWKILSANIKVGTLGEDLWKVFRKGIWWVAEYVIVLISATDRAEYWAVARDGRVGGVFRGKLGGNFFGGYRLSGTRHADNFAHFNPICNPTVLLRICAYLCKYAYELIEKTWLFSVMSLEKGSTLFTS